MTDVQVTSYTHTRKKKGKQVDFSEALRALKAGSKVRRAVWKDATRWGSSWMELAGITVNPGEQSIPQLVIRYPDGRWFTFAGSQWDILSDDWELAG